MCIKFITLNGSSRYQNKNPTWDLEIQSSWTNLCLIRPYHQRYLHRNQKKKMRYPFASTPEQAQNLKSDLPVAESRSICIRRQRGQASPTLSSQHPGLRHPSTVEFSTVQHDNGSGGLEMKVPSSSA